MGVLSRPIQSGGFILSGVVANLCCPTHHSTGPARKAAQAGEFKR
jgi:hypothetical protein